MELIKFWQKYLSLNEWVIKLESINRGQVIFPEDIKTCDKYYIGIYRDFSNKQATIYYDRELTDADVLHELLHIKFPKFSENQINYCMEFFLKINNK